MARICAKCGAQNPDSFIISLCQSCGASLQDAQSAEGPAQAMGESLGTAAAAEFLQIAQTPLIAGGPSAPAAEPDATKDEEISRLVGTLDAERSEAARDLVGVLGAISQTLEEGWRCADCGLRNDERHSFCANCGSDRPGSQLEFGPEPEPAVAAVPGPLVRCGKCGRDNLPQYFFCEACGAPLRGAKGSGCATGVITLLWSALRR
jgi:predicted  nucleic acid-binding Zn-ribbon protein